MKDLLDELAAVHRQMGKGTVPYGEAYTVELRRRYDEQIDDVWDAITRPERLRRWFLPVTGDLRLGGQFQLEGNANGEILQCEPPRLLKASWLFGGAPDGTSEVEIRLTPGPDGDTELELIHVAAFDPVFFPTYGPGAGGVGWDLGLLALALHLVGRESNHLRLGNPAESAPSPEEREFSRRSAAAWGEAHLAAGGDPQQAAAAVEATTKFYVPDPA